MEHPKITPINISAIVNPFSGRSNKTNIEVQLQEAFNLPQYNLEILRTEKAKHAKVLSRNAVQNGAHIVIAIGGDGTVNEVAGALIGTDVKLGIISMGSGNGFARHLGIHKKIKKSLDIIKNGKSIKIDTCAVNDKPFVNVAGIGFDGKVAYLTKKNKKRGLWQYVWASLRKALKAKPIDAECCTDTFCISGKYKAIVVANASLYGFNFSIAPMASLQDGYLDIMLLKEDNAFHYFLELPRFMFKNLHKSKLVEHHKTKHFEVKVNGKKTHYHLDGEGKKTKHQKFIFTVRHNSLNIIVGDNTVDAEI